MKKQRRIARACDYCHQRSIRCLVSEGDEQRCKNCFDFDQPCTFTRAVKRRGVKPNKRSDVEARRDVAIDSDTGMLNARCSFLVLIERSCPTRHMACAPDSQTCSRCRSRRDILRGGLSYLPFVPSTKLHPKSKLTRLVSLLQLTDEDRSRRVPRVGESLRYDNGCLRSQFRKSSGYSPFQPTVGYRKSYGSSI